MLDWGERYNRAISTATQSPQSPGGVCRIPNLTLAIPDSALSALRRSPAELGREMKLAAAIHWYGRGLMSQERAAELAGMNRRDFMHALAREGVDVFVVDDDSLVRELGHDASGETTAP